MQASQAVQANLNMFHLHLSTLFQMASRQLLVPNTSRGSLGVREPYESSCVCYGV